MTVCHRIGGKSISAWRNRDFSASGFLERLKCGKGGSPVARDLPVPPQRRSRPQIQNGRRQMSEQEQAELRLEFARLKQEHADFDAAINAMMATGCDPLQIQRMKKKKLALKDKIAQLEDRIVPDIIA